MPFSKFLRWLLPKEDHFYDFLERQATVAHQAASALKRLPTGRLLARSGPLSRNWNTRATPSSTA